MRKFTSTPSLTRRIQQLNPKVEIVIACEGKNTEPEYISDCVRHYGAGYVHLRVIPRTGVPITVVKAAVQEREALLEKARRSKKLGQSMLPFKVWAIFDKDEHEVDEAIELAREKKVEVAFSNPCFELWPILHLEHHGSQDGRHFLQRRLNVIMPTYDHDDGAKVDFELIKENFGEAYSRAQQLNEARRQEGCSRGCPSTTMGELVIKIIENGKYIYRKKASQKK